MKLHRKFSTKKTAAVGAVAAATLAGGIAVAAWTANGTGPGQAQAISAESIVVTARTGEADLYPGFTDGDVYFALQNPNPFPVRMTAMTPGAITSSIPGCAATNVTVDAASGLTLDVPAEGSLDPANIAGVVNMALSAPDACQGAVFTVQLTLTGVQTA